MHKHLLIYVIWDLAGEVDGIIDDLLRLERLEIGFRTEAN